MSRLKELNEARILARHAAEYAGAMNTYGKSPSELLALDAGYQLASDAWLKAEAEYRKALRDTPTSTLMSIIADDAAARR